MDLTNPRSFALFLLFVFRGLGQLGADRAIGSQPTGFGVPRSISQIPFGRSAVLLLGLLSLLASSSFYQSIQVGSSRFR